MHIAFVIAPGGGPETFVRTILTWFESRGHRVSVIYTVPAHRAKAVFPPSVKVLFAPPADAHYYLSKMVRDYRAWPRRLRAWEYARSVSQALGQIDAAKPIDLVEVVEGMPISLIQKSWPTVVRAHGSDWSFQYFCKESAFQKAGPIINAEARQLISARAVYAISEHLADHLSEFCRIKRSSINVQPYPIDTTHFSPGKSERQSIPAVMQVGRLEKRKGTDLLVRAMSKVWQRFPETDVYLLGNEAELTREQLLELVPARHRERVIFPGFVAHEVLPNYYRNASVYVTPTQYETFGYTVLEAMACGKPVVASDVGAIHELVENGETGLLVPFGDVESLATSIESILADPKRATEMGIAGRQKALGYDLNVICPMLEKSYQQMICEHRR